MKKIFPGIDWFCDNCNESLDKQVGFSDNCGSWTCANCGHLNFINANEIIDNDVMYDENVNYSSLEKHMYEDTPGHIFYTCPRCGGEYLATFIIEDEGETLCIDCWNKKQ